MAKTLIEFFSNIFLFLILIQDLVNTEGADLSQSCVSLVLQLKKLFDTGLHFLKNVEKLYYQFNLIELV